MKMVDTVDTFVQDAIFVEKSGLGPFEHEERENFDPNKNVDRKQGDECSQARPRKSLASPCSRSSSNRSPSGRSSKGVRFSVTTM